MKMIAPKINGQSMQEVYWDPEDKSGNWSIAFNDLEIRVFKNRIGNGGCTYRVFYNGILINSYVDYGLPDLETPQDAADQAIEFLTKLNNVIKYIV